MSSMESPSVCEGRGGKAMHLRDFGNHLLEAQSTLRQVLSDWPDSSNLEPLRQHLQKLRGCRQCAACVHDRQYLLVAVTETWQELQHDEFCNEESLRKLDAAFRDFVTPYQKTLCVRPDGNSELWFMHDSVRPRFSHGDHKGTLVAESVDQIVRKSSSNIDFELDAVWHHGRFKAFNNRRLWSVWEASKKLKKDLFVKVRILPLVPGATIARDDGFGAASVLRKFEISHSTKTNGEQPPMRKDEGDSMYENSNYNFGRANCASEWIAKYETARFPSGELLRTSTLPLLSRLPEVARQIVESEQQLFILNGSTGCGKSTQVPQAVYDHVRAREGPTRGGFGPHIVCTQPRRIAACSLDGQVHLDRTHRNVWPEEQDARITAHQIQGETNKRSSTRMLFCTAGVLIQMMRNEGNQGAKQFEFIFLDEVHERTIEDDLLLTFMCSRKFLHGTGTKVVVMSATLSIPTFTAYLSARLAPQQNAVGSIDLDREQKLDLLSVEELKQVAQGSGLDLQDYDDEDAEGLVQVLLRSQVVRPHPMRLVYLDDLLSDICLQEFFEIDYLRPVGFLDPQIIRVAEEAWSRTCDDFEGWKPLKVMLQILHDSSGFDVGAPPVVSDPREHFAKHFCRLLMRSQCRHHTVPIVNDEELDRMRAAISECGSAVLESDVALAAGFVPRGARIQSFYVQQDGTEYPVSSKLSLPSSHTHGLLIIFTDLDERSCASDSSVNMIDQGNGMPPYVTLVFLPGLQMLTSFQYALQHDDERWHEPGLRSDEVWPLHSKVRQEDQNAAVQVIQSGRRAILSTNIAESSVTVPNANVVIDMSLSRKMIWNRDRLGQLLDFSHATKDSLNQRAGRVARTKAGLTVRMLTRDEYDDVPDTRVPEMLRRPVDQVALKVSCMAPKGQSIGVDIMSELKACLSPPPIDKLNDALLELDAVHAIHPVQGHPGHWKTLRMGVLLEDLPMEISLGLMVGRGVQLGAQLPVVDAVVMLQAHNVLAEPRMTFEDGGRALIEHCAHLRTFAGGFSSDAVVLVNVLRAFRRRAKEVGWVEGSAHADAVHAMRSWCRQNKVNFQSISTADTTIISIHERLKAVLPSKTNLDNDMTSHGSLPLISLTEEEAAIVMLLFCGAFCKNLQQVRSVQHDGLLQDSDKQQWHDSDVIVSWGESKDVQRTISCITNFFKHGKCGVQGKIIDRGSQGMKGGWLRVRLIGKGSTADNVFGFPSEVTDVLRLKRDFSKFCEDGFTRMDLDHKGLTSSVPMFWRWEPITKKREDVMLPITSIVNPYLRHESLAKDSVQAAIFAMRFDSFDTKKHDVWQKGETLTLLPNGFFCEAIVAIFGNQLLQPLSGKPAATQLLQSRKEIDAAQNMRKKLASRNCLLQQAVDMSYSDWVHVTQQSRQDLLNLIRPFGGPNELQALRRQSPQFSSSHPSFGLDGSDVDDSELESDTDLPSLAAPTGRASMLNFTVHGPGANAPSCIASRNGAYLLVDFDYWWQCAGALHATAALSAEAFHQVLKILGSKLSGTNIKHVSIFDRSFPTRIGEQTVCNGIEELYQKKIQVRNMLKNALQCSMNVAFSQFDTWTPNIACRSSLSPRVVLADVLAPSEIAVAMATRALQLASGYGNLPQRHDTAPPSHIIFLASAHGIRPVLEALNQDMHVAVLLMVAVNDVPVQNAMKSLRCEVLTIPAFSSQTSRPQKSFPAKARPARAETPSSPTVVQMSPGMTEGQVKSFNSEKGFGFLIGDELSDGRDIWFGRKNCVDGYVPSDGDHVHFKRWWQRDQKPCAKDVQLAQNHAARHAETSM